MRFLANCTQQSVGTAMHYTKSSSESVNEEIEYKPNEYDDFIYRPVGFTQTAQTQASAHCKAIKCRQRDPLVRQQLLNDVRGEEEANDSKCASSEDEFSASCCLDSETQTSDSCIEQDPFAALVALLQPKNQQSTQTLRISDDAHSVCSPTQFSDKEFTTGSSQLEINVQPLAGNDNATAIGVDVPPPGAPKRLLEADEQLSKSLEHQEFLLSNATSLPGATNFSRRPVSTMHGDDVHFQSLWMESRRAARDKNHSDSSGLTSGRRKRVGIVRAKHSIVGSMPKHWGARITSSATTFSFTRQAKSLAVQALARPLAAPNASSMTNLPCLQNDTPSSALLTLKGKSKSFMPSFLLDAMPAEHSNAIDEVSNHLPDLEIVNDASPFSVYGGGKNAHFPPPLFASPPPNKKRKNGVLMGRLQQIRSDILGDAIRLQSGQYPFQKKIPAFDTNDPRTRATSWMNVTIVGDMDTWGVETTGSSSQQLFALGFVHDHVALAHGMDAAQKPKECLVMLLLNKQPIRSLNLQKGSALRLYNTVATAVLGPITWVVTCTDLCELYPSDILGELFLPSTNLLCYQLDATK
ncbi:hypothetical protein MPSEU_000346800 [Mayamaea pseudoterrestris]|nr:hypothetical protein MPSEU_000346800 [Mayamaea pseudoterrestris]